VDCVIVGFGLAVSPLDEDREAIALDMARQGYGPDVLAKAMKVADATAAIMRSDFREGYDRLDAVRKEYAGEAWFKHVHGDFSFFLLGTPTATLREKGPALLAGVPADYDPMPVLRNLDTPQLWILAADDHDAPSAETERRLRALQAKGKPITVAVFPNTEHGIYEFETKPDGTRVNTRNPEGYFAMMRDFIVHGRLDSRRYGTSTIHRPADKSASASTRH
jgi:pimeloyl-ACP methyl ester carboxylesterase